MASDLSSGCTETIDILDEKEEGEISLEDVSSSEEGGIGHLTRGYVIRTRRSCPSCKWDLSTTGCAPWCYSKTHHSKSQQSRRDPVKGKENRHHVNEAACATTKHMVVSTLHDKNDDLVPISSDSDMELVGLADAAKQLAGQSKTRVKKKKKKKKEYECFSVDDLISPASVDIAYTECFGDSRKVSGVKGASLSRTHYRESSPLRRNGRSRAITRSPLRKYRIPVKSRSPFRSSRSPSSPPLARISSRRIKSPKRSRSPYESTVRTTSRKLSKLNSPPSRGPPVDRYGDMTKELLKKVNSVGARALTETSVDRSKEYQPTSLREKLSNMTKKVPDSSNGSSTHHKANKTSSNQAILLSDADDEEDLALLRQKALETKQKNRLSRTKHPTEAESERKSAIETATRTEDDQDEEDLQLRMIALRSAVMKKHQNRVQRGIKRARSKKATAVTTSPCISPPYMSPSDICTPCVSPQQSQIPLFDINHVEDMELDTDVEREKEKLPYSPTDKITADVPIDTELLGIEPSDVSFISLNNANESPIYAKNDSILPVGFTTHRSYLPHHNNLSPEHFADSPSPPGDGDDDGGSLYGGVNLDNLKEIPDYLRNLHDGSVGCDLINGICLREGAHSSDVPMNEQTDLPMARNLPTSSASPNHVLTSLQTQNITEMSSNDLPLTVHVDSSQLSSVQCNEHVYEIASSYPVADSSTAYALRSPSSNGSMVTIDDLPETDRDPVSPVGADGNLPSAANHIPSEGASCQADETTQESLHPQGVTNVTKDVNKISTIITLVPAPILKSNKWLQQPLPKRPETHPEPAFKSAEMQPVIVNAEMTANNSTNFKPIKLTSLSKKPQTVLTIPPIEFDDSVNETIENASRNDSNCEAIEQERLATDTAYTASNNVPPKRKKRKRVKRIQRKDLESEKSAAVKKNVSCTNDIVNKDVNMIENTCISQRVAECDRGKSNEKTWESSVKSRELSNLQNTAGISPSLNLDSNDINVLQNTNVNANIDANANVESNDEYVSSKDKEVPKRTLSIIANECSQEGKNESIHCLPAKSNDIPISITEVTKEGDSRRQSVDENEDELRAILLASLTKRTAKPSVTITSTIITNGTVNAQVSAQKMPVTTATSINTTNNSSVSSTSNSLEVSKTTSDKTVNGANDKSVPSLNNNRKRSNSTILTKGPSKKAIKKVPVSASTKVVNNAKKYQNMIVQRKVNNLQKYDASAPEDKTKSKQNNIWSTNAPIKTPTKMHTSDTQRIVINLGSDTDSESETEKRKNDIQTSSTVNANTQDVNSDFEKNLHNFLRDVRKKHESAAASSKPLSPQTMRRGTPPIAPVDPKNSSNMDTPLAVRHLPASKQEEYRRLKQRILEHEKLKLQKKTMNKNGSNNKLIDNIGSAIKSLLPCDKESMIVGQTQVKLKELESNCQRSPTESKTNNADTAKNASILNIFCTSSNKTVSENIAKQTSTEAKSATKTTPNFSICITNDIVQSHVTVDDRTTDSPISSANKYQFPSDNKQQFRPALRTLSKDEINRKYVQIQLKQDAVERIVTINDKFVLKHNTAGDDQSTKLVENGNVSVEIIDEKTGNISEFSNASTIITGNLSADSNKDKQDSADTTLETTISRSQYEREREMNCNISASSPQANRNNSSDSNDTAHSSDVNANAKSNKGIVWNASEEDAKVELDSLKSLSEAEQQRYLHDTEHKLISRRYTVLDHLAEMSRDLCQWDMEMDLQSNLAIKVKKRKEQLRIAEEKLQAQRNRVGSMGPKISTARQKISAGQRECFKLSEICSALGNRLVGKDYKLPEAGNQLLSDKLKEVANHTRQLSKKKSSSNNSENSVFPSSSQASSLPELSKITSVEDPLLQKQLADATVATNDLAESRDDISHLERLNDVENSSTLSTFPSQTTSLRTNQASTITLESCSNGQDTPNQDNILPTEPKLSSTPILVKQNSECTQRILRMDTAEPTIPTEPKESATDSSLHQDDQQSNERTQLPPSAMITTAMATTVVEPYISILKYFKTPRNANPNGILCPYDLMGTCNDKDCKFIHQSTST